MKLLCCELKKLFNNRMPWLLLAVLLTANVLLMLGQISEEREEKLFFMTHMIHLPYSGKATTELFMTAK